ncbi:MAG: MoaD/ThiS family protein [Hyphomonas sp.]
MATILFLGKLADALGTGRLDQSLPAEAQNTTTLRNWLDAAHELNGLLLEPTVRVAINNDIVQDPHPLQDTDEIAFMPPVGGG